MTQRKPSAKTSAAAAPAAPAAPAAAAATPAAHHTDEVKTSVTGSEHSLTAGVDPDVLTKLVAGEKLPDGTINFGPPTQESVDAAEKDAEASARKLRASRDRLSVRTTSGGVMLYFDANVQIGGEFVQVPNSRWVQAQIAAGKLEEEKYED